MTIKNGMLASAKIQISLGIADGLASPLLGLALAQFNQSLLCWPEGT